MKSLNEDLKTGQFKNCYLLFGEEEYLKRQYLHRLQDALVPPGDDVNRTFYAGRGISVQELIDQGETLPFFAKRRLLVVEDSGFFKSASQELADYLEHLPETTFFLFAESEVDKRGKLYKAVKNHGRAVEFARQNEETLTRWVLGTLKREDKNITRRACALFLEKTGNDMNNISTELEKLLCYTMGREVITPEDVESVCTTQTVGRIFEMVGAIAEKNRRRALELYYDLLALKEPPLRILYLIGRQFNQVLQAGALRGEGYDTAKIASKMGVQPFVARNCVRQAGHFSRETLQGLVEFCVELEEAVKTGSLSEKLCVELVIARACGEGMP